MTQALEGIKILDMSGVGPGGFSSTMLGDLGADLIKVYPPEMRPGSMIAAVFPQRPGYPGRRNCRSICIDLSGDQGRQVFYDLTRTADVVMDGFRPGATKGLGVDYDTLKKVNPRIICASMTSFGQTGPYRDIVGHDIDCLGVGGFLATNRYQGGPPVIPGTYVADFAAGGMSAVIGILAALVQRQATGRGQFVDVSMTDPVIEFMGPLIAPHLKGSGKTNVLQSLGSGVWPWYNVYETKDGKHICLGAAEPWFFENVCRIMELPGFIKFQYAEGEKREEIRRAFKEKFLTRTRDEWLKLLQAKDTCAAPMNTPDEIPLDPHVRARGMVVEVEHPTLGLIEQIGSSNRLSDSPFLIRNWTQRAGQNTADVLREIGYDDARITALRDAGIINKE